MRPLEEILLWLLAVFGIFMATAIVAFFVGTVMGFFMLIAKIAFQLWGVR